MHHVIQGHKFHATQSMGFSWAEAAHMFISPGGYMMLMPCVVGCCSLAIARCCDCHNLMIIMLKMFEWFRDVS